MNRDNTTKYTSEALPNREIETKPSQSHQDILRTLSAEDEGAFSRKLEPKSIQSDETSEGDTIKMHTSRLVAPTSRNTEAEDPTNRKIEPKPSQEDLIEEEDLRSRKLEPKSLQFDGISNDNTLKLHPTSQEDPISRKTEPKSSHVFKERLGKSEVKDEENLDRKAEPRSLQPSQFSDENTLKIHPTKYEAFPNRKMDPYQSHQATWPILSVEEEPISRKMEPKLVQLEETSEYYTMKMSKPSQEHLTEDEDPISRKLEPNSTSSQFSDENTLKIHPTKYEAFPNRKMDPYQSHQATWPILSVEEEPISRKMEPKLVQLEETSEYYTMKIRQADFMSRMSRNGMEADLRKKEEKKSVQTTYSSLENEADLGQKCKPNSPQNVRETAKETQSTKHAEEVTKFEPFLSRNHLHFKFNEVFIEEDPKNEKNNFKEAFTREEGENEHLNEQPSQEYIKLELEMKELKQTHLKGFMAKALSIMQQDTNKGDDYFLIWVRFLDISAQKFEDFQPNNEEGVEEFKQQIEELVLQLLFLADLDTRSSAAIDWRIAKKILSLADIFPRLSHLICDCCILTAVENEVEKALAQTIWLRQTSLTILAKQTLQQLQKYFRDDSWHESLKYAIIVGRFDKEAFGLNHSLILGEDGGLYLLLNRLTKVQQEEMVKLEIVTEDYLEDKIIKNPAAGGDENRKGDKVVLGKGGFGTVSFALSLFRSRSDCGDVICIKKTRSFAALASRKHQSTLTPLQIATEAITEDYFASDVADNVYAPQIFDLAIISDSSVNQKDALSAKGCHQKAYLMMEMFPQNTATQIFKETRYQKWKYQKPYLQEVMLATSELLKNGIAFTDLKPANTLFDPETLKTTIIDLGGSIRLDDGALDEFDKMKHSCQLTPGYFAPEMMDSERIIISLSKALAYTCGQVMEKITRISDYNGKDLQDLIAKLTQQNPDHRISIEEAFQYLKKIGDETTNEDVLLNQYIAKIRQGIESNRSSISLNEDILSTKEFYIDIKVTAKDPEKYKNQETEDLFKRIESFFTRKQNQHEVMVILGSAGSGKSIALQLKFIEAIQDWKKGHPLPIYFNLANGIHLKNVINSMNTELGTNLKLQELKNDIHLYIDSFDEGLEIEKKRETIIKEYITELNNCRAKLLITCRSSYLKSERDYSWFTPHVNEFSKLSSCYIAPISYVSYVSGNDVGEKDWKHIITQDDTLRKHLLAKFEQRKLSIDATNFLLQKNLTLDEFTTFLKHGYKTLYPSAWEENAIKHLGRQGKKQGVQVSKEEVETTLKKMAKMNLDRLLDTGLMFHIVMKVLPELLEDENQFTSRSKHDIYLKYVTKYQKEELDKLTEEQKTQVTKYIKFISKTQEPEGFKLTQAIKDLGKYLAVQLHLHDKFRLDQDSPIFQAMGYESETHFKKQVFWYVLKILPLKIETKHTSSKSSKLKRQEVKVGFVHDTIKNCYLLDAIREEMFSQNEKSPILAGKSIIADIELVKFIADAAYNDDALRSYLRKGIDLSKDDKSQSAAIYAANCITILTCARYSFQGQDLSNINISCANLKRGIFSGVDFTGANLSQANIENIQASGAKFSKTNLVGAKLGILPDLKDHTKTVNSVSWSGDGRYVASCSNDKTVKIWEAQTSKCLATLQGHTSDVKSVSFSRDGRHVASGSNDDTVKIWEVETHKCLTTLKGHKKIVWSVSFSGDGRYVASGSDDNTVKIWEVQTGKCVTTLQSHTKTVNSVSWSGDDRYVASCSNDKTVKIWEAQTSKCLATLQGHTSDVKSVSFSRDGRHVASGSNDDTVKIWEVETHKCLTTLKGHKKIVWSVSFSGDGRYVASGSDDNTVKIWEVQTGKCLNLEGHTAWVMSVSFSDDGRYVASGSYDKTVKIWEFSDSMNNLLAIGGHTDSIRSANFSSDGRYLVSGSDDETVRIWEVKTGKCLTALQGHFFYVSSVSFSGDGRYVVSGSDDKTVKIWEVETHTCLATLEDHTNTVTSVSFSQDQKYVASGSYDKTVRIWEVETAKCLTILQGHKDHVTSVSFSGDGRYVASSSDDDTVRIWEVKAGKCLVKLKGHKTFVMSVSWSGDGRNIASSSYDKTVRIWAIPSGKCLAVLQGHTGGVRSVSFSGDGRYVVSGSDDKTVKIWEVETNKCLTTLQGHTARVMCVSFSNNGNYVASSSEDKTVKIWAIKNGCWLLDTLLSDFEPPIRIHEGVIEETALSAQNLIVFEQYGAQTKTNTIVNNIDIELEIALSAAETLFVETVTSRIAAYKKLEIQKRAQINLSILLEQAEQHKNPRMALDALGKTVVPQCQWDSSQEARDIKCISFSIKIYKRWGDVLRAQKLFPEAIESYNKCFDLLHKELELNLIDEAEALNGKGLALLELDKQSEQAIICFEQALKITPENALYQCNRARALDAKNPKDLSKEREEEQEVYHFKEARSKNLPYEDNLIL